MRNLILKQRYLFILIAVLTFITACSINSPLNRMIAVAAENNQRIYDDAGILSTTEYHELEEMCISYGNKAGIDIFILTHDNSDTVDGDIYIENFYDAGVYGDSVILLIDLYRRDVLLQGYGKAEDYLNSNRLDKIRETITPYLSDAEYATAFEIYIEDSADFMGNNPKDDSYEFLFNIWFQLAVSLAIGGIVVGTMAYNSGGRMTAGGNTYIDPGHSGLIGRRDNYIRTTVTRVRKPTQNSGGGLRGGISAGGHSHSSSRGKF